MIRVKNNGTAKVATGIGQTEEVFEGYIKPIFGAKGKVSYDVLFTGHNPAWYETKVVTPAVKAVAANPDKGIEAVEAKPAVLDECLAPKTIPYGYFSSPAWAIDCDHEGAVLLECTKHLLTLMGPEWEISKLNKV